MINLLLGPVASIVKDAVGGYVETKKAKSVQKLTEIKAKPGGVTHPFCDAEINTSIPSSSVSHGTDATLLIPSTTKSKECFFITLDIDSAALIKTLK